MIVMVVVLILILISGSLFKISNWHTKESECWYKVGYLVGGTLDLDDYYRPILMWVKAKPPSILQRLRRWESPEAQMREEMLS